MIRLSLLLCRFQTPKDVAVIAGNKWFRLEKGEDGTWRGEVPTGTEGEVKLSAKVEENTSTFNTFASFQVTFFIEMSSTRSIHACEGFLFTFGEVEDYH